MLDRMDYEPVFFAPFVSSAMAAEREWADFNGHLNVAYYGLMFDRAFDEALALLGLGPKQASRRGTSFLTGETHTRYLRELPAGAPVRVTLRLVSYDDTRMHLFQALHHGSEGWIAATSEQVAQHVDLGTRRASAIPDDVLERIAIMRSVHAALPAPEGMGRKVCITARC